jgi:hypothetical protein
MFNPNYSSANPAAPTLMAIDPSVVPPTSEQAAPMPVSSLTMATVPEQHVSQAPPATPPTTLGKEEHLSIKDLAVITSAAQRFEKLNGINWITWKDNVTNLLEMSELEGHITSTAQCPDPIADPVGAKYWKRKD